MRLALALAVLQLSPAPIQDTCWIRLVDAETGAGLAAAVVTRDPNSDGVFPASSEPIVPLGITDGDGYIAHRDRRDIARVEVPGYSPALYPVQLGRAERDDARVIEVLRDAHLSITVVDARGEPAEGVHVQLTGEGYLLMQRHLLGSVFPEGVRFERATDSEGRATFEGVPAECPLEVTLREVQPARKTARPARRLVLGPGERRTARYRLGVSHDVVGHVVGPGGERLADVPLALRRARSGWPKLQLDGASRWVLARTDAAGTFRFASVPVGDWWLGVPPRWGTGPARALTVLEQRAPDPIELVHWADARVSVRAVPPSRPEGVNELEEVYAHLTPVGHGGPSLNQRADARRPLQFEGLPPGAYDLTVSKNGFGRGVARVEPGDVDVEVDLLPQGRIRGRVLRHPDARVVVESIDLIGPSRMGSGSSDGLDEFDFRELRAGTYSIAAVASDGQFGYVSGLQVSGGELLDGVELSMGPGVLVRVRWRGAETYANVRLTHEGHTVATGDVHSGTTVAFAAPPGELVLELEGDRGTFTTSLAPGARDDALVEFPRER